MEQLFTALSERLLAELTGAEALSMSLAAESSHFTRINAAMLRQTGLVEDAQLSLSLILDGRKATSSLTLTQDLEIDFTQLKQELTRLRQEVMELPQDPYLVFPAGGQMSRSINGGQLPEPQDLVAELLPAMQGHDIAGIYASGRQYRGHANSAGSRHWFEAENFAFDYSLLNPAERMVKGIYAGSVWDQAEYEKTLADSQEKLRLLDRPSIRVEPGQYRTYIAPAGVSEILDMFSWHGVSEHDLQTGESALLRMRSENRSLSPHFSLSEDFSSGLSPRFNGIGEVAPDQLSIISNGALENTLISSRTAKEYQLETNYASSGEYLRAPAMAPGVLGEEDVLAALDTGIYLSNLHYLNWSDIAGGRITGMTRYACFWVEGGVIQGPIENMRFDDSLYHFFGEQLEAVTLETKINPDIGTYGMRSLGGTICPGILLSAFTFTL